MPDLMGHHLSDNKGEERDANHVNHKADFLYTKACSVVIRPEDPADKFNVDGEVLYHVFLLDSFFVSARNSPSTQRFALNFACFNVNMLLCLLFPVPSAR